jgi:hypothetical protein
MFEHKGCLGFGGEGKIIGPSTFLFLAQNVEFFIKEDFAPNNHTAIRIVVFMPIHYARDVDRSGSTLKFR